VSESPDIRQLTWIDERRSALSCPIVIGGRGAYDFVRAIHLTLGGQNERGQKVRGIYSKLDLPKLRGLDIRLHLYGSKTERDDAYRRQFWDNLAYTRWLVISSVGPLHDRSWVETFEVLSRHLDQSRPEVVLGLHGPPDLAAYAQAAGLPEPVVVDARPMAVLKAMSRSFLHYVKRAGPSG